MDFNGLLQAAGGQGGGQPQQGLDQADPAAEETQETQIVDQVIQMLMQLKDVIAAKQAPINPNTLPPGLAQ